MQNLRKLNFSSMIREQSHDECVIRRYRQGLDCAVAGPSCDVVIPNFGSWRSKGRTESGLVFAVFFRVNACQSKLLQYVRQYVSELGKPSAFPQRTNAVFPLSEVLLGFFGIIWIYCQ